MIVSSFGSRSRTAVATFASTGSAIITAASQSLTRKAISAGVIRKFTGTAMAPSLLAARKDSMNSVRFSIRISTRSPNATPRRLSALASAETRRSSSAQVVVRPKWRSAVASGCINAWRAKLVGPVLPSREIRLIGRRRLSAVADATLWLSGQRLESPGCTMLIFDQTLGCEGHTMAYGGHGTTPRMEAA